jgi:DNA-dependent RNA polymerase auxiliary subunit epsilon
MMQTLWHADDTFLTAGNNSYFPVTSTSFAFRIVLVAENVIFGIQQLYADKDSEVTQFFKKIFRLLLLPPVEVSECFASDFIPSLPNNRRIEQFCDYFPEHYINAGSNFPLPLWSECSTSPFSSINVRELFRTHFKAQVDRARPNVFVQETAQEKTQNKTYTKMQGDNTRRLKNQQPSKKVSKIRRYLANLSSRIEFVTSVSHKFLPNPDFYFLITFILVPPLYVFIS